MGVVTWDIWFYLNFRDFGEFGDSPWFYFMIPSIDNSTISFLTMLNNPEDWGNKDVGAFCCYSFIIQNYTCNIGKIFTSTLHPVP